MRKYPSTSRFAAAWLLALGLWPVVAAAQRPGSALDDYLSARPNAIDSGEVGPMEVRILDALTPKQAEAYANGADPGAIVLEDGETLADLMATILAGGNGLVYVPLDKCLVFKTAPPGAGVMTPGETRQYFVRGTDLSAQAGSATGCMVPPEAVAAVMHFRIVVLPASMSGVPGRLEVERLAFAGAATIAIEYLRVGSRTDFVGSSVLALCEGAPCGAGDIEVTTVGAGGHVRGDVIGYFRPIVVADLPGGMGGGLDADTLDGLDSTAFAMDPHTHDGGDIVSGTVGEPYTDPLITRDGEVLPIVLASDGPGSGLDADLLDGKDSTALLMQVGNCLTVSPSCPPTAPDALAQRCWTTISAALAEIGAGLPAASAVNRYLVKVGPGIYTEQVTMKQFVDIEGSGVKVTQVTNATSPTLAGANDATLASLTIENTGAGTAVQTNAVSPMLKHVKARAVGGATAKAIEIIGATASPTLNLVTTESDGDGVENTDGTATVRGSVLGGTVNGIENVTSGGTPVANIVNAQILGGASDGATGTTFSCLGAYDATFTELDPNCQ